MIISSPSMTSAPFKSITTKATSSTILIDANSTKEAKPTTSNINFIVANNSTNNTAVGDSTNITISNPRIPSVPVTPSPSATSDSGEIIPIPTQSSATPNPSIQLDSISPNARSTGAPAASLSSKSVNASAVVSQIASTPTPSKSPQKPNSIQFVNATAASNVHPHGQEIIERPIDCGDGICSKGENCISCAVDCSTPFTYTFDGTSTIASNQIAQDCVKSNPYVSQCQNGNKIVLLAQISLSDTNSSVSVTQIMNLFNGLPVTYLVHGEELDASTKPTLKTILNYDHNNVALDVGLSDSVNTSIAKVITYYPELSSLGKQNVLQAVNVDNIDANYTKPLHDSKMFVSLEAPSAKQEMLKMLQYITKNNGRSFYVRINTRNSTLEELKNQVLMLNTSGIPIVGENECNRDDSFEAKELSSDSVTVGSNISDASSSINGFYILLIFVLFFHFH